MLSIAEKLGLPPEIAPPLPEEPPPGTAAEEEAKRININQDFEELKARRAALRYRRHNIKEEMRLYSKLSDRLFNDVVNYDDIINNDGPSPVNADSFTLKHLWHRTEGHMESVTGLDVQVTRNGDLHFATSSQDGTAILQKLRVDEGQDESNAFLGLVSLADAGRRSVATLQAPSSRSGADYLVAVSAKTSVRIWTDVEISMGDGEPRHTLRLSQASAIHSVCGDPLQPLMSISAVSLAQSGFVSVWAFRPSETTQLRKLTHDVGRVGPICMPCHSFLISHTFDGGMESRQKQQALMLWDLRQQPPITRIHPDASNANSAVFNASCPLETAAGSGTSLTIAMACNTNSGTTLESWDIRSYRRPLSKGQIFSFAEGDENGPQALSLALDGTSANRVAVSCSGPNPSVMLSSLANEKATFEECDDAPDAAISILRWAQDPQSNASGPNATVLVGGCQDGTVWAATPHSTDAA